jgi:cytochrome P450
MVSIDEIFKGKKWRKFLNVVTECVRIRSTATHLSRMCTQKIELEAGESKKITLYPGDIVLVASYSMHMDENYFPNPEVFDPERFSNGAAKYYIDQGIFLPFGIGPRSCPGNRFGFIQTKMCLAALVSNFEISLNKKTPENVEIHPQTFVATVPNCYLNFKPLSS